MDFDDLHDLADDRPNDRPELSSPNGILASTSLGYRSSVHVGCHATVRVAVSSELTRRRIMGAFWAQPLFMHCLLHIGVVCIQQGQYMSGSVLTPDTPDEGIELSGEQRHLDNV